MEEEIQFKSVLITITGFPIQLWHQHEFEKLIEDFLIYCDMDKKTRHRID